MKVNAKFRAPNFRGGGGRMPSYKPRRCLENLAKRTRCAFRSWTQSAHTANNVVQRLRAKRRQQFANFARNPPHVTHDHFRLTGELRPKLFVLRRDSHRARVQMALARHDASHRKQRRGAKSKFVSSK